jgi:CelD/BcsL family acetyltransferase involved in cellulose biosynthesis
MNSSTFDSDNWRWDTAGGRGEIDVLAPAWDDLVHALELPFIGGALWSRCFWEAFGEPDRELAVLSARHDGRLVAILPLMRATRLLRRWTPAANLHSPSLVFAAECPPLSAASAILDRLLASADLIDLGPVAPDDRFCRALVDAARSRRLAVVESAAESEAVIELRGSWEEFCRAVSRNLHSSTTRHHRQLQRLGKLVFEEITGGERLDGALEECFQLEAAGWKASGGSPILARRDTHRFYTDLARQAAAVGALALYVLKLDGRPIAFEYCLRAGRRIDMLKISYAPDLARYSPGNVLRYMILKTEIGRGRISVYHMGRSSEWKLRWANRVEARLRLRIYGTGARARVDCWAARLRTSLSQFRLLRATVHWARRALGAFSRLRLHAARPIQRMEP